MHLDVLDLRAFYDENPLGRMAARVLAVQLARFWPPVAGEAIAGFGYTVPLLPPYLGVARRVFALMPGPQGVVAFPNSTQNISVLIEETAWPLPTGFLDRLLVLHGLETSQHPEFVLEESARVLGPGGRALFIVPNRSGLWARHDATPFGFGRPYSSGQLETQLRCAGFDILRRSAALFSPPSQRAFWQRSAPMWERIGQHAPWLIAGVTLFEVSKSHHAPISGKPMRNSRRILGHFGQLAAPRPIPISRIHGVKADTENGGSLMLSENAEP